MLKRIACLIMAFLVILSVSACNEGKKVETNSDVFSMANIPDYEELEISKTIGIQTAGTKLELNAGNQLVLMDRDQNTIIADTNGKKLQEYKNNAGGHIFTLDAHDNMYIVKEQYGNIKEGDKKREAQSSVIVFNSTGKKQKTIDLGKRTYTDQQSGITDICVDTKDNIYLLQRRGKIEVYDADGKKIKDIKAEKIDYIEIDDKDNLLLGSFSGANNKSTVEKCSLQKEDYTLITELNTGDYIREIKYSTKNKKLYLLTDKGVVVCSSEGKTEGYAFDLKQSSLLDTNINITDFDVDNDKNIYILAIKSDTSSGEYKYTTLLYKYIPGKGKKHTADKTLHIALRYSESYLEAAIAKYQKQFPDVKVDVKDYRAAIMSSSEDGPGQDEINRAQKAEEDYQKIVSTELMAGKGADIMDIGGLQYHNLIDKNTLADISEIIEKDKTFDINKYNKKILNIFKYKDRLFYMPINFSFNKLAVSKNILDKEGITIDDSKWTWKDFMEIAQKIKKDKNGDGKPDQFALPKLKSEDLFGMMLPGEYDSFIDFSKKTCNFNSKEFIEMLKYSKEFVDKGLCSPKLESDELYKMLDPGTIGFMTSYFGNYQSVIMEQSIFNGEAEFLKFPSYSGKKPYKGVMAGATFAINNKSKVKAEAWEFIKLLISDDIQSRDDMYQFPININAMGIKAKNELAQNYMYKAYKDRGRKVRPLNEKDVEMVNKIIEELDESPYFEQQASNIVTEAVKEYFSGKKTAEETAQVIQNKISIYLNE